MVSQKPEGEPNDGFTTPGVANPPGESRDGWNGARHNGGCLIQTEARNDDGPWIEIS